MRARTTIATLMFAATLACSRDQDTPPENETGGDDGATDTGGDDTAATMDADASADSTADDESGTGDACLGADGCYDCEPTEPEQVLNHCTDAACEPFPNTQERLPLIGADGTLPPLP